jgi:hypothetical protein
MKEEKQAFMKLPGFGRVVKAPSTKAAKGRVGQAGPSPDAVIRTGETCSQAVEAGESGYLQSAGYVAQLLGVTRSTLYKSPAG